MSETPALQPLPHSWLLAIQAGQPIAPIGLRIADGAVPPPHVAERSLRLLDAGCATHWALPYNIVDVAERVVVGGCGFKGAPLSGVVEIGYAVAAQFRRRGYAGFAIRQLQHIAARSAEVTQIEARIAPDNEASMATVAGAGFVLLDQVFDDDGETITRWRWRCRAGESVPITLR